MVDVCCAYLLWATLGVLGIHRFYTGHVGSGLIWLFTGGLCGIGWLVDLFLVPGLVSDANRRNQPQQIVVMGGATQQVAGHVAKHAATHVVTDYLKNR